MTTALAFLRRQTLLRHLLLAVVGIVVLLVFAGLISSYRNTQLASIAATTCAVAGLTVLTGLSGQISLGHGAFMFVGAYTVALILEHHVTSNAGLVWVLIASALVTAVIGGLVGIAAARLRGPYLAGLTLALALGLPVLPKWSALSSQLGGHAGIPVNMPPPPGTQDPSRWTAYYCCVAAVLVLFLLANLVTSRVGRDMRAVRDDEVAASLAGLNVARVQITAFVVSAGCAGLGGGLLALINLDVGPDSFPLSLSLSLLAAVVIGGLGSLAGAVWGSIIVTLLPTWSTNVANALSLPQKVQDNLPLLIFGAALMVAVLLAPQGIQGGLRSLASLVTRRGRRKSAPFAMTRQASEGSSPSLPPTAVGPASAGPATSSSLPQLTPEDK